MESIGKTSNGFDVRISPEVGTTYVDDFLGTSGFSEIEYGACISAERENFNLEGCVTQQKAIHDFFGRKVDKNEPAIGINFRYEFN